jgi:hypothetical protein
MANVFGLVATYDGVVCIVKSRRRCVVCKITRRISTNPCAASVLFPTKNKLSVQCDFTSGTLQVVHRRKLKVADSLQLGDRIRRKSFPQN